jgi:galactose oxidase
MPIRRHSSFNSLTKAMFTHRYIFSSSFRHSRGHSFLPDGKLLVTGGHDGSSGYGYPYASIDNSTTNSWTQIPNMQDARWYPTNTTLANGDLLVVSGEITLVHPGTYSALPQIWHPSTKSWLNLTSAQLVQPLYPMMFVAPNGKVFKAGVQLLLSRPGSLWPFRCFSS